jgi:GNAT superfamily N-acetyltransferase
MDDSPYQTREPQTMTYLTLSHLNHPLWPEARRIYEEAFPPHSRKPEPLIGSMLERGLALVHILAAEPSADDSADGLGVVAMAIAGSSGGGCVLVVDYLAVDIGARGKGYGTCLIAEIDRWAGRHTGALALVVEAESEPSDENRRRLRFWEQAGFQATEYIHQYIWVPEPYRALYRPLSSGGGLTPDEEMLFREGGGQQLFRWISEFHRRGYNGFKKED